MDNVEERHQLIEQEIEDTLKHWQRLLLMGLEDDVDSCIEQEGCQSMRKEYTRIIMTGLTYTLHGCDPLLDDEEMPEKIRKYRQACAQRVIAYMAHDRLDRFEIWEDAVADVLRQRPDLEMDLRGIL